MSFNCSEVLGLKGDEAPSKLSCLVNLYASRDSFVSSHCLCDFWLLLGVAKHQIQYYFIWLYIYCTELSIQSPMVSYSLP